jgi:probable phosphoglycerate mutase
MPTNQTSGKTADGATEGRNPRARRNHQVPPSTLVLLVRHGTTPTTGQVLPGRAAGLHLAESGQSQAGTVAERLASWATAPRSTGQRSTHRRRSPRPAEPETPEPASRIAAVYSSPLERTRETAAPIARALGLKVQVDRGLIECDFGEWTGAKLKDLMKKPEWSTVQRYPSGFRFPSGESFAGMQARMVDALGAIRGRHPGQAVVAVSHADPIKAAVAEAMGSHLDLFQRIVISPCSVTAISYGAFGPMVLAVNSTSALTDLVPS